MTMGFSKESIHCKWFWRVLHTWRQSAKACKLLWLWSVSNEPFLYMYGNGICSDMLNAQYLMFDFDVNLFKEQKFVFDYKKINMFSFHSKLEVLFNKPSAKMKLGRTWTLLLWSWPQHISSLWKKCHKYLCAVLDTWKLSAKGNKLLWLWSVSKEQKSNHFGQKMRRQLPLYNLKRHLLSQQKFTADTWFLAYIRAMILSFLTKSYLNLYVDQIWIL